MKEDVHAYFAAVKADFGVFLQQAFHELYPGKAFDDNWHVDAIVHALEENLAGRRPRLVINLPPRHLKSFLASVAWPAFLLTLDPSLKIFCVSYSDDLARTIARDFKRLIDSPWYRALFPQVRLAKSTENEVVTTRGGYRLALSVHGSITGKGADLIIVDDPCRPEEAVSDKSRTAVNEWFGSTLLSRRDDKQRSGLIIVMQRLHVNDLTGFVGDKGFYKLSLPAIAIRNEEIELPNGRTYCRHAGEVLQPLREDRVTLDQLRDEIGEFNFAAQYQQAPRTPDGQLFKRKNFHRVNHFPPYQTEGEIFISIDSAQSTTSTADFTAITIAWIHAGRLWVLKAERGRWDYETLKFRTLRWIKRLTRPERPVVVVVERAGSGIALAQFLRDRPDRSFQAYDYVPRADKITRACRVMPHFEDGIMLVDVDGHNDWLEPYINEFMNFPNGANDDQVDSLVQLLHCNRVRCQLSKPSTDWTVY